MGNPPWSVLQVVELKFQICLHQNPVFANLGHSTISQPVSYTAGGHGNTNMIYDPLRKYNMIQARCCSLKLSWHMFIDKVVLVSELGVIKSYM